MTARIDQPRVLKALLLGAYLLAGAGLIRHTSPTTDEVAFHMVNGYTYLRTHDYRMSPANPPLLRQWMALPWLIGMPQLRLDRTSWQQADSEPFAREFFYGDHREIADRLLYGSRAMILLLGLLGAVVVHRWSRSLYGERGALLSLAAYVSAPPLLGHAAIAHTDVGVSVLCLLAFYRLWRYLTAPNARRLWFFAAAFGLAGAAKYNALYFAPVLVGIVGWRMGWKAMLSAVGAMLLAGGLVVWASYGLECRPLLGPGVPRIAEKEGYIRAISGAIRPGDADLAERLVVAARTVPIPAPSYILGIAGIVRSHQSPYWHYSFGRWGYEMRWYHYLFSFATKMTIPFLLLLLMRALWRGPSDQGRGEGLVLLLPMAVTAVLTAKDSTGVGLRYLFPAILPLFVWVGGVCRGGSPFPRTACAWMLAAAGLLAAAKAYPVNIGYFNEFVGGTSGGYRYVRGGDVDWGQGLKPLKRYLDERGIGRIKLRYFGTADPTFYGLDFDELTPEELREPGPHVYAISLFYLEHASWTSRYRPDAMVDGCIFVYDLRRKTTPTPA
ncbi:MAG: hypothetical protein MOGMAGMI_00830 [Candidatus Omnitrophica bacterium]|nr:hypothetical protein [Candidatus Omnitrophota bacterium]